MFGYLGNSTRILDKEGFMKIVKPSIEVTFWLPERERGSTNRQLSVEEAIEKAARTCYKSEDSLR